MSDVPDLSSDEEHSDDEEWQEMETCDDSVSCLFCATVLSNIEVAIKHSEETHNFRLKTLKTKFDMDHYSYIKLINFIKTHKPCAEVIMNAEKVLWEDEVYLKPVGSTEWLLFDFESLSDCLSAPQTFHANIENGIVTLSQAHFMDLQNTIHTLSAQVKEGHSHLQMAREDMDKMKASMKKIIDSTDTKNDTVVDCVSKVALEDDEGYFSTYAHFGIHHEMLSDKVRTESYKQAILNNREILKGKTVLDLGCGTGILSMFAASAGAKTVYALDQSEIVFQAMDIVRENNMNDTIEVIKGRLEDTRLDSKVDVIISEWMGYFLLFEGMLDSVIYARDHCLENNGLLLPNRCNISLVANGDVDTHKKMIEFWSDVYGYKMNCMKSVVVSAASVDIVESKHILSAPCIIKEIDINTCTTDVMNFKAKFSLPVIESGSVTSLVGYFDTFFDLPCDVSFSTGPSVTPTHWKQTVFYFRDCKDVKKGDTVEGTIECSRQKSDVRSLNISINVFGKNHEYILC